MVISENKDVKNHIWNAIAGGINASEAVFVLAVVNRVNGIDSAGIFSIAFSLGNLFMTLGKFGVKNYQVIHGEQTLSFKTYLILRKITVLAMLLLITGYTSFLLLLKKANMTKILTIIFVCLWYLLEAYEDVYFAKHQLEGNLYKASQMFILRWIAIIGSFLITDYITKKILFSLLVSLLLGLSVCTYNINNTTKQYGLFEFRINRLTKEDIGELHNLSCNCFPLFLSDFAYYYINNMSKYSLNRYQSNEIQAIYSYIAMPVFIIPLLNSFLYQPRLVKTASLWKGGAFDEFIRTIINQLVRIIGITIVCMLCTYLFGVSILSLLYHTNLEPYKMELLILIFVGFSLAVEGYSCAILTVIGWHKAVIFCYGGALPFGFFVTDYLSKEYAVKGAAYGYAFSILILTIITLIVLSIGIKKMKKNIITVDVKDYANKKR